MKQELNLLDGYTPTNDLLNDAKQIIEVSQKAAYRAVNLALVQRNWLLGYRIAQEELREKTVLSTAKVLLRIWQTN